MVDRRTALFRSCKAPWRGALKRPLVALSPPLSLLPLCVKSGEKDADPRGRAARRHRSLVGVAGRALAPLPRGPGHSEGAAGYGCSQIDRCSRYITYIYIAYIHTWTHI